MRAIGTLFALLVWGAVWKGSGESTDRPGESTDVVWAARVWQTDEG